MDKNFQELNDIIEWDVKNWGKSLNYWLEETSLELFDRKGLEIGSRNGGLSLWLAKQGCSVVCSDIKGPTEKAREVHKIYGVSKNIEYSDVDATNIPFENESFDVVIFKSVLGGIGNNDNMFSQKKALSEIYRVLKPGGELFFAENLSASPLHKLLRNYFVKWGKTWSYISIEEMNQLLVPFSSVKYTCTGFLAALGRNERQRKFLGTVDHLIADQIIPEKWKYIYIGVAKK